MPSDYHYEDQSEVFVTTYWGQISILEIIQTIQHRAGEPRLATAKAHVIDVSNAAWVETPPRVVHGEADRLRPAFGPPKARHTVFIAPADFWYGFARMYAVIQEIYGAATVRVVRSWSEAAKLLELDLGKAEAWARARPAEGDD